MKVKVGS